MRAPPPAWAARLSAAEIIEQIKTLPLSDRREVFDFVKQLAAPTTGPATTHREKFERAEEAVFSKHREALRKTRAVMEPGVPRI